MIGSSWIGALAAALVTLGLTPVMRVYAQRKGLIDHPGPRRSHHVPIARGGGLALAVGVIVGTALLEEIPALPAFLVGLGVIATLGLFDDHRPLPVRVRLPVQMLVAVGVVAALGGVETIRIGSLALGPPWLWSSLAILAVVWMINLFNFMDGSDGLAVLQAAISGTLFTGGFLAAGAFGLAGLSAVIAAGSLGFLVWNRPPAAIFLGDSGSLSLGFVLGFVALAGTATGRMEVLAAAIAVSPFVIDATATLAARLVSGREWYTPHRDHAYQCLIRSGWSHARVLAALLAINLVIVLPSFALAIAYPGMDGVIAAITGVMLLALWRWSRGRAPAEDRDV